MMRRYRYIILAAVAVMVYSCSGSRHASGSRDKATILKFSDYKHYVDYFNTMEDENIVQAIPNDSSWNWMQKNIPLFACPDKNAEELFYYRWWTLRKHIKKTPLGYAFTEFLVQRTYADQYNLIACALGHHIYEGRWLHDKTYLNDYLNVWFRGNEGKPMKKLHGFSSWAADAVYNRYLVTGDRGNLLDLAGDLESDYYVWEEQNRLPSGLFWQTDVKDGMEETISGGRRVKNARPTINSYMYGNAMALSKMFELAGNGEKSALFRRKADTIKALVQGKLWNADHSFFEVVKEDGTSANVREAIGFIPWYFNLPNKGYEKAWATLMDTTCFNAPFGLTTADRSHPEFRTHGCCKCEWDGAVWPFATSQTMTALANLLNNYQQDVIGKEAYFHSFKRYVESQYYRGRPYIGEYLDEKTGYWLKGDQERSRYYNHSTFNDLIITGLVGLRPRADNIVEINPLLPDGKWDWFCLDNILYRGKLISVVWDKTGTKFGKGAGLSLWIDGKKKAVSEKLGRLTASIE